MSKLRFLEWRKLKIAVLYENQIGFELGSYIWWCVEAINPPWGTALLEIASKRCMSIFFWYELS